MRQCGIGYSGEERQSSTSTSTGNHPRNADTHAEGDSSCAATAQGTFGHGHAKEKGSSTEGPRRRCHKTSRTREQESDEIRWQDSCSRCLS